tara:strand:- start:17960 stop:19240 length:1281 start_codon:yes stop_codon:yes gene_type:complete
MLNCDNITSAKRFLPEGSALLLGDQILEGCAIKTGSSGGVGVSEEELEKNRIANQIFGVAEDYEDIYIIGEKVCEGEFISELGFTADEGGVTVIHSGYGGEARNFAPGTDLKTGDLVLNGFVLDPNGVRFDAPQNIDGDGFVVGESGAVVSPGAGNDDDEAYCSLQELAGKADRPDGFFDEFSMDLDLDIPDLDMKWWFKIQKKINDLMSVQNKFMVRVQLLVDKIELEPDDACKLVPDVNKLIKLIQRVERVISRISRLLRALSSLARKLKKIVKLLKWIFSPLKIVEAYFMVLGVINGIPQLLATAAQNMANSQRVMRSLLALLQKIIAQCIVNRGAEAGLTKEQCEAAGGVYIERRLGDLGDSDGGELGLGLDDLENFDAFGTDEDGEISFDEFDRILSKQSVDLEECLLELDDIDKAQGFVI